MPTHQDETLPQQYAREHQDYLNLCGSMTAEQVADLQLQLHNSLAREQALQQRLTAADELADEMEGLLREYPGQTISIYEKAWTAKVRAALKPAGGGGDEAMSFAQIAQFNDDHDRPPERDD